jgi:hypothetical protein
VALVALSDIVKRGTRLTTAVDAFVGSAVLVAVILTVCGEVIVAGAV